MARKKKIITVNLTPLLERKLGPGNTYYAVPEKYKRAWECAREHRTIHTVAQIVALGTILASELVGKYNMSGAQGVKLKQTAVQYFEGEGASLLKTWMHIYDTGAIEFTQTRSNADWVVSGTSLLMAFTDCEEHKELLYSIKLGSSPLTISMITKHLLGGGWEDQVETAFTEEAV